MWLELQMSKRQGIGRKRVPISSSLRTVYYIITKTISRQKEIKAALTNQVRFITSLCKAGQHTINSSGLQIFYFLLEMCSKTINMEIHSNALTKFSV